MKRLVTIIICITVFAALFAGCSSGEPEATPSSESASPSATETPSPTPTVKPVELIMGCAETYTDTKTGEALTKGIDDLTSWSGGHMSVELYEGGKLGADAQIIEGVISGDISLYFGTAAAMQSAIPGLAVCDIPMMFSTVDECNGILDGAFKEIMQPYFNELGMQLVGVYCPTLKTITCSKPIALPEDLAGLRLGIEDNQYYNLFWRTVGFNAFPMAWTQVYIGLKQGLLEAQEGFESDIYSDKLYDVQSDLIKTRHVPYVGIIAMNKAQYDALTDEEAAWLNQFLSQVETDIISAEAEAEGTYEKDYAKKITVSEPSPEVLETLKAAIQPVVDLMKQNIDPAVVDSYLNACGYQVPEQ